MVLDYLVLLLIVVLMKSWAKNQRDLKSLYNSMYFYGFYFAFTFLILEVVKFSNPISFEEFSKTEPIQIINAFYVIMMFMWIVGPNEHFVSKNDPEFENHIFIVSHPMSSLLLNRIAGIGLLALTIVKMFALSKMPEILESLYKIDSILSGACLIMAIIGYWLNAQHVAHCMVHYPSHVAAYDIKSDGPLVKMKYNNKLHKKAYSLYHDFLDCIFIGAGLFMNRTELSERGKEILGGYVEREGHS